MRTKFKPEVKQTDSFTIFLALCISDASSCRDRKEQVLYSSSAFSAWSVSCEIQGDVSRICNVISPYKF